MARVYGAHGPAQGAVRLRQDRAGGQIRGQADCGGQFPGVQACVDTPQGLVQDETKRRGIVGQCPVDRGGAEHGLKVAGNQHFGLLRPHPVQAARPLLEIRRLVADPVQVAGKGLVEIASGNQHLAFGQPDVELVLGLARSRDQLHHHARNPQPVAVAEKQPVGRQVAIPRILFRRQRVDHRNGALLLSEKQALLPLAPLSRLHAGHAAPEPEVGTRVYIGREVTSGERRRAGHVRAVAVGIDHGGEGQFHALPVGESGPLGRGAGVVRVNQDGRVFAGDQGGVRRAEAGCQVDAIGDLEHLSGPGPRGWKKRQRQEDGGSARQARPPTVAGHSGFSSTRETESHEPTGMIIDCSLLSVAMR